MRPGPSFGEDVGRVYEFADAEGEASAPDASAEPVAKVLQAADPFVKVFLPRGREPLPIATGRGAPLGKGVEGLSDPAQRDAYLL